MKEHAASKTTIVKGKDKLDLTRFVEDCKTDPLRFQELQEFASILQQEALKIEDCQSPDFRDRLDSKSWHGNKDKPQKDYGNCQRCDTVLQKARHARGYCKVCYAKVKRTGEFEVKYYEKR